MEKNKLRILIALMITLIISCGIMFLRYSDYKPNSYREIKDNQILIATWNIQILGKSKMKDKESMNVILNTISNFDVVAIQEERSSNTIIPEFTKRLNKISDRKFDYIYSKRLGRGISRSISKERYFFVYNRNKFKVLDSFVFDNKNGYFERPPFCVYFKHDNFDFILVNYHSKPSDIKNELPKLVNVVNYISLKYPNEKDVFILGDFNANDRQISKYFKTKKNILFSKTYSKSNIRETKLYDNIISMNKNIKVVSKRVINLKLKFDKLKKVSDHFPLEIRIQTE